MMQTVYQKGTRELTRVYPRNSSPGFQQIFGFIGIFEYDAPIARKKEGKVIVDHSAVYLGRD